MKRPFSEISNTLMLHPANLLIHFIELKIPLSECWPDIEDSWLEALKGKDWEKFGSKVVAIQRSTSVPNVAHESSFSNTAMRILDKLHRKGHWGSVTVPLNALKNHYCHGVVDFEEAFDNLNKQGYLNLDNRKEEVSLSSHKKGDIDKIVDDFRKKV